MDTETPVVRFEETSKHFGDVVALDRLTLQVGEGRSSACLVPTVLARPLPYAPCSAC
jgi:ABC-type sugar transport system ATPase subunit